MKLIIAGTRDLKISLDLLDSLVRHFVDVETLTEVLSGGATGIDELGEAWTRVQQKDNDRILLHYFPADWDKYGKYAGPIRNEEMAKYGDELLLVWTGESPGSKNMKKCMEKLGKPVHEVVIKSHD